MLIAAASVYGLFGLASVAGGYLGYKKAGSRASLIAGGVAGGALLAAAAFGAIGMSGWALGLGGGTSLLLAGRFAPAYFKTKKMMPQGMMTGLSAISLVVTASALLG